MRTKNRHAATFLLLAASLTAALSLSCGIKHLPTRNYYMITSAPDNVFVEGSRRPYPIALQVASFTMQRIYNRQNILYRFSPNQIQYYEIERWAVKPDVMFTDAARTHLESAGLVNRVGTDFLDTKPDFRLEGTVLAVEKLDAGDLFYARLAILFKMVRVSDGLQVWEYEFDERQQVFQKEMVYTVRALSALYESQMNIVVEQLDRRFLELIPPSAGGGAIGSQKRPVAGKAAAPADTTSKNPGYEILPERR